jgi:hypothetical protein
MDYEAFILPILIALSGPTVKEVVKCIFVIDREGHLILGARAWIYSDFGPSGQN